MSVGTGDAEPTLAVHMFMREGWFGQNDEGYKFLQPRSLSTAVVLWRIVTEYESMH